MAMSPNEYRKLMNMASLIRRQVSEGVQEIDEIMKVQAKIGESDWVTVCLDRGLGTEVYEGIVKEYLRVGWYKVYVAVVHQHDDSTYTQFVFCTEDSEEKFEKSCGYNGLNKWYSYTQNFIEKSV
jgi:hypothetical protein